MRGNGGSSRRPKHLLKGVIPTGHEYRKPVRIPCCRFKCACAGKQAAKNVRCCFVFSQWRHQQQGSAEQRFIVTRGPICHSRFKEMNYRLGIVRLERLTQGISEGR
jgi:hypothetical protein